jgi:two-component system, OmpR family, alkaline phosphatase synthesis response regulator PhoP
MSARILLVEDEPGLVLTITDLLAEEGYETESAADGETGAARARSGVFDLLILDWMLPRKPGLEVCSELRKAGIDIPILMLTARSLPGDRVTGLKTGADDYLGEPFEPAELLARVEALLRRSRGKTVSSATTFQFGNVQVNYERSEVKRDGELVTMAAREFELLTYMIAHRARMITREEILRNVWKYSPDVSSRTIDVHIAWLRQKLEEKPQTPVHIITMRRRGYRFME